ncbi:GT4 family glycosyltransferase PelF [Paenibacillus sp. GCM10027626]|uniref:GT4 family glycosyltransferase PelF n=1 Tax=Paenibacillus sp. GCM10027626 TaxID=3273411 RepID=UPI00362C1B14
MRICIIAEGSYPYITGGVSSWIHSLMTNLPEFEFVIHSIGAHRQQQGQFKYTLPPNVIDVKETFLDEMLDEAGTSSRVRLDANQKEAFLSLLSGNEHVDWAGIFSLLRNEQFQRASDFLMSRDYFDVLTRLCEEKYSQIPFTEMVWTVRSMVLPLFSSVREEIPQADLYHSVSTGYAGVIGALAKYLYNKPFLLTEHGIYSREREEEIIKADWVKGYFKDLWIDYFYRLSGSAYDSADQVITLFNRNREIEIELGCRPDKIAIIPNGVHLQNNQAEPAAVLPAAAPNVVRLGAIVRIVPIKDIKTMIHSFALVKQQVPDAELYIMGPADENDEYHEECLQLVDSLQVEGITFTGEVRVAEYLPHMDLMLLSSVSEGMPLAVMEAMASSKPVVATDVGSCRELLHGRDDGIGQAGEIVPVMHYEQMANAIIQLCANRKLREQMGKNGLERIRKHYMHDKFIASYRELYSSMGGVEQWRASASN